MLLAAFCGLRLSERDVYCVESSAIGRDPPLHSIPRLEPWSEFNSFYVIEKATKHVTYNSPFIYGIRCCGRSRL